RFPHICRVSQDGPYRCAIPAWTTTTCGHTVSVEGTNDLADGLLLANEGLEDATNHLRLMQEDAIAGGSIVGFLHVQEPVRGSAHRINGSLPSAMELAATTAFEDLRPFVLRDHPLNLHEQLVLCGLALRALEEDQSHALPAELVEQH